MRVTSHRDADQDVVEAIAFYREHSPRAAERLIDELQATTDRICIDPLRFPIVEDDVRRARVNRFPFDIYYIAARDSIKVIALTHHHRHPDHWRHRLDEIDD